MPGADYKLVKRLDLNPLVRRIILYQQGCFAGGIVIRVEKDLTENNLGSHVLLVCSKIRVVTFQGPSSTSSHLDNLIAQALAWDGETTLVVGAEPEEAIESPLIQLVSASQAILP
ncbi:hypothetical protein ACQ4PT_042563 [Festuca glaucescens]